MILLPLPRQWRAAAEADFLRDHRREEHDAAAQAEEDAEHRDSYRPLEGQDGDDA